MSLIENLNWRHATKAYDPTKKVSKENLLKILEAARLAPSSSGLQPFRVIVVEDKDIRERLMEGTFNPECMRDCSFVLVFAAWDEYSAERIDTMYDKTTTERELPQGRFNSYTDMLKKMYGNQEKSQHFEHAARQTYIALGLALAQAAELKIDITPAEGFNNDVFDEVLNLRERGLKSVNIMYLGYRDADRDWLAPMKKVRNDMSEFVVWAKND